MTLYFCRSNDLGGFLIRLFTRSKWNHVAVEVGGQVYESMTGSGVRRTPVHSYGGWAKMEAVEVPVTDPLAAYQFLHEQIGKPYDWLALLWFPFRVSWQAPHKWFCSELAAKAIKVAGADLPERVHRITPEDLRGMV